MTNEEIRNHLAQHLLGAAMGIGLIVEGLAGKVEPGTLTDEQQIRFAELAGETNGLCARWAELGLSVRGGEEPEELDP